MNSSGYRIMDSEMEFTSEFLKKLGKSGGGLEISDLRQGWGQLQRGCGIVDSAIKIKGGAFRWGLAGHADSEIGISSRAPLKRLKAYVGIDSNRDSSKDKARPKVVFSIVAEGVELWRSRSLDFDSEPEKVDVALNGAMRLSLFAKAASGEPVHMAHIDWAELAFETESGEEIKAGSRSLVEEIDFIPASFMIGGESSGSFLARRGVERLETADGAEISSFDPESGLKLLFKAKRYGSLPVVEWRVAFENAGKAPTKILSDAKSLSLALPLGSDGASLLRGRGSYNVQRSGPDAFKESFLPVADSLGASSKEISFGSINGRPSDPWMPYFNLHMPGAELGFVFAIGWSGQWSAKLFPDGGALRVEAGIERISTVLLPGERIELPSIYMIRYEGPESLRGNNLLRRFLRDEIAPKYDDKPIVPPVSNAAWGGIAEAEHLERIENIKRRKLPVDVYWIDAGWYAPPSDNEHSPEWSSHVGDWRFNPEIFPSGTKPISDAAHKAGMKFLLWVEPERAVAGTLLPSAHPDWFLGTPSKGANLLLNLGVKEACDWCIDYVSELVERHGVDFYREDFNIAPLALWRSNDAPDRQGMTEIKAVAGLYRFWSELRRRFPKLMIDNCSSGGRRLDIELLRHSVPLWASDMQCYPGFNPDPSLTHVAGLSLWFPFFAFGTQNHEGGDTYNFRANMAAGIDIQLFYQRCWPVSESYPYDWLRARLAEFHACKDCFSGDYYPLSDISLTTKAWTASQFFRPDLGKGVLTAFRRGDSDYLSANFRLFGLNPSANYEVMDFDSGTKSVETGADLMNIGLCVEMPEPRSSRLLLFNALGK